MHSPGIHYFILINTVAAVNLALATKTLFATAVTFPSLVNLLWPPSENNPVQCIMTSQKPKELSSTAPFGLKLALWIGMSPHTPVDGYTFQTLWPHSVPVRYTADNRASGCHKGSRKHSSSSRVRWVKHTSLAATSIPTGSSPRAALTTGTVQSDPLLWFAHATVITSHIYTHTNMLNSDERPAEGGRERPPAADSQGEQKRGMETTLRSLNVVTTLAFV